MAIDVRTIQMRRGLAVDFNPAKMVPGEWAVSQDNEKLYMCFTAGRVVEVGTTSSIIHYVEDAEAWAVGTRDGVPVDNSQPQYENNSKYYAEIVAFDEAQNAEAWARGSRGGTDVPSTDPNYHNNSKYYSEQSDVSAIASAVSALNAATSEDNAEAWARGTKNGTNVPSTDPTYHNNSKYYSEVANSYADDAEDHKENSEAWAVGTKNGVPVSSSDPQYQNSAKDWAEVAEAVVGIGIATTERAGIVKPDGETILVEPDGKILAPNVNSATENFVEDTVGWTGKNLIPYPYENTSVTHRGITFTANNDGAIGYAGTASAATTAYALFKSSVLLKAGSYKLTGGDSQTGGLVVNFFDDKNKTNYTGTYTGLGKTGAGAVYLNTTQNGGEYNINNVYGYEKPFTINSDAYVDIYARSVSNAYTSAVSGTIYPMLRFASINDATYEPYHPSVKQTLRDAEVIEGKNLISYPYRYARVNGNPFVTNEVTYTQNLDGSLSVSGTASGGNANYYLTDWRDGNDSLIKAGTYTLSGCPSGGASSTYCLILYCFVVGSNGTEVSPSIHIFDTGEGTTFTLPNDVWGRIYFRVLNGATAPSGTVYPMLRYITEEDDTYEPYYIPLKDSKFDRSEQGILGAKNLIPYPYVHTTKTENGITFVDNGDGTVTVSGTASAYASFICRHRTNTERNKFWLKNGEYELSGCPNGGATSSYYLKAHRTYNGASNSLAKDTGNGATVILNGDDYGSDGVYLGIIIEVLSGTVISSPITFKPMLRYATDADGTYQPYAETNYQLTHNKVSYEDNGVLGAKNLLPYPYINTTKTQSGITFTDNGDGSVLVNGTATAEVVFEFNAGYAQVPIEDGEYIVSGCPSGGSSSTYSFQYTLRNISAGTNTWISEYGSGAKFTETSNIKFGYSRIRIMSGAVCDNLLFKPMIRLASDPDDTWQPYAMTNKELTDANKELTDGKVSKTGDTITGTLILSRTTDASGTVNNKPALIVGGTDTQPHIEIDSNEIMAKADGTTTSELYLNNDGGLVMINNKIAGKFTSTPTDKYVLVADGTEGNIKSISTLPVAQGGTGHGSAGITANAVLLGNDTSAFKTIQTSSGAFYATASNGQPLFGALPVPQGGTGHGSNGLTTNAVLLGNGTSAFKTIATRSGAFYATATNGQPLFGILPVAQGGTGGSTAAAARSGLDVYSKGEVNTNINNLNTAINGKASLAGAKFTGNVDTNGYLYVSNGTTSVGFHSGTHNSTQCVNTTAPIQSNYGALVLASLGSTHVVSIRGKETHIRNNADSAYVKIYASAFDTSSSRRYKENIQNLSDEEAKKLLDVNVVTFDFKKDVGIAEDNDRLNKFGVIAEDVVEICPDVVSFREIDGEMLPDSVDYSKFVPRLIKMIQIQEERINELERRINNEL